MSNEPDVNELPKFDALRTWLSNNTQGANIVAPHQPLTEWLDKLEAWCKQVPREMERLHDKFSEMRNDLDDAKDTIRELESEVLDKEGFFEMILDVDRGILDFAELMEVVE